MCTVGRHAPRVSGRDQTPEGPAGGHAAGSHDQRKGGGERAVGGADIGRSSSNGLSWEGEVPTPA